MEVLKTHEEQVVTYNESTDSNMHDPRLMFANLTLTGQNDARQTLVTILHTSGWIILK